MNPGHFAIFAVAQNGAFGLKGGLPWRCLPDLQHFASLTRGLPLIAGRITRGTLPPKMKLRCMELSRRDTVTLDEHLADERQGPCAIIGGAQVLWGAVNPSRQIKRAVVSLIHQDPPAYDVSFSLREWADDGGWVIESVKYHEGEGFAVMELKR